MALVVKNTKLTGTTVVASYRWIAWFKNLEDNCYCTSCLREVHYALDHVKHTLYISVITSYYSTSSPEQMRMRIEFTFCFWLCRVQTNRQKQEGWHGFFWPLAVIGKMSDTDKGGMLGYCCLWSASVLGSSAARKQPGTSCSNLNRLCKDVSSSDTNMWVLEGTISLCWSPHCCYCSIQLG